MAAPQIEVPYGVLANNHMMVKLLGQALSQGTMTFNTVPGLMTTVIEDRCWEHWIDPHSGLEQRWRPHEFRRFVEADRPNGLQTKFDDAARYFTEDTEAYVAFHQAGRGEQGQPNASSQPRDDCGKFGIRNRNNMTVTDADEAVEPDTVPFQPKESQQGTSVSYAIRRLGKQRPDLLEQVKAGDLSPHGAMVVAGFTPKAITVPAVPADAGRRLAKHFTPEQFLELTEAYRAARGV